MMTPEQQELRRKNLPKLVYPELPILAHKQRILQTLKDHQVIIVAGETGSGKTTQLPKICLEAGCGISGLIGHTQPRRIAARTVASRIATELESPVGEQVGYKVRFSDRTKPTSYIKIMTDGILLSETQSDPLLSQYDCLIIDEAHERSLNIDFLLGYLKMLLSRRKDIKIIVTSATIDIQRFSDFFDQAPIIEVEGRTYPVEVKYLELIEQDDPISQVLQAVEQCEAFGDILIFQSGEKEIREVCEALQEKFLDSSIILPLFARQSVQEQQRIFQSVGKRKIIVATNVAETSLTVPNIRYVIDSGMARVSRYNYRSKLQRLPIEPISQASAEQRKGRCGRVGPGICYRLYSQEDLLTRPLFTEPEILRTNLAGVILKMLSLGFKEITAFPFIDPPDHRYLKDGFSLLERLQAVEHQKITPLGRLLANIPIEPRLGRILIAANQLGALKEVLIIVSGLSIVDVRERPLPHKAQADEKHARFVDEDSDFFSLVKLWNFITEQRKKLSQAKFKKLCHENFFSFIRICEWFDVHQQLQDICKELGFKFNQIPADYSLIHKALLAGLLDSIGVKEERKEYLGARNLKFFVHPSSGLFVKSPLWIVAYEIVHTTKTYARTTARIDPRWLEEIARHLLKRQYFEPHLDKSAGRVVAFEKITLFGLEIVARRKVNYERINPVEARQIFIQQGLVLGELQGSWPFYVKNKQTIQQLHALEDRMRRRQLLVDESAIYRFYNEHLPEHVHSAAALNKWLEEKKGDLTFQPNLIMSGDLPATLEKFPEFFQVENQSFALRYQFDLTSKEDGVMLCCPIAALPFLKDKDFSWLVPGLLEEKITAYLKALPKKFRARLVPLPAYVHQVQNSLSPAQGTFTQALAKYMQTALQFDVSPAIWDSVTFPPYLQMHFMIVDNAGEVVARGDDLNEIYHDLKIAHPTLAQETTFAKTGLLTWDFELAKNYKIEKAGYQHVMYPALVDDHQQVSLQLFETPQQALEKHRFGFARLALLNLSKEVKAFKSQIDQIKKKQIAKMFEPYGSWDSLLDFVLLNAAIELFFEKNIYNSLQFSQQLQRKRAAVILQAQTVLGVVAESLQMQLQIAEKIKKLSQSEFQFAVMDIQSQLEQLFTKEFVKEVPFYWLKRYPVYLKAIMLRLEKLPQQLARDKQISVEIKKVQQLYLNKMAQHSFIKVPEDPWFHFRWLVEEWRVSSFAQTLKTVETVSKVRLLKLLDQMV